MQMTKGRIAAIVAAATLGAAAFTGAAIAVAADGSVTPAPSGASAERHGPGERPGPGMGHGPRGDHGPGMGEREGGHMLHGEGVVEDEDGNYVTVRMQEGEATAVSATSITVKSADGYTSTYALDDATETERDGVDGAPQVGDTVHVRATVAGETVTVQHVHALSPEKAKELQEHRAEMEKWMAERPEGGGRA